MMTHNSLRQIKRLFACLTAALAAFGWANASAQSLTLANPHWNITLTDAGYSDFLLDNTPGFEGREYLSGEWGAAVGYVRNGQTVAPQWLEPMFLFPDWTTLTTFHTVTAITQTGLNADNLPIAQSVLANSDLQITLRCEMLDTVVGVPMGLTPASSTNAGNSITSSRYVMKQTATIKNISGVPVSGVQFFQFLHGLSSQRGVYDDRPYAGRESQFRYDVTLAGVDPWSAGTNTSDIGLEDYIGFSATNAPSAFELGYYGIEGNGVDDHGLGKPSDGVHRSIEANWLTAPYSARLNTDAFQPPQRWVAGAERYELGSLAANQSVSVDILLSLRTGTRVSPGTNSTGSCGGGSSVTGGLDYEFDDVHDDGSCFSDYSQSDQEELDDRIAAGEFGPITFLTAGGPLQVWNVKFTGTFNGLAHFSFGYDPTILPAGFDETQLAIYHYHNGAWSKLTSTVDPVGHSISFSTPDLSAFALGADAVVTYTVEATPAPANSGTITGAGTFVQGASASLVASPASGYVFANWTENAAVVSTSPSYSFVVEDNHTIEANFVPLGTAKAVSTSSTPTDGGTTSGDGAYAAGSSATVVATAAPGYKFSKWLRNGATANPSMSYTFTVTSNVVLVAKFKPIYTVTVSAEPPEGGDAEADSSKYDPGELAKMQAQPNDGWSFVNWTQNGVVVSTDPDFQFNVTGNRTLVGNFALGHRLDLAAEPANGGSVSGAGVWPNGSLVPLEAVPHAGYAFRNWTQAGDVVGVEPGFTWLSAASESLVANFVAQPALTGVVSAPGALALTWPVTANGWLLQEATDLGLGNWTNSTRTVTTVGSLRQVLVPTTGAGPAFFRLTLP
jgi:hypothetical protein